MNACCFRIDLWNSCRYLRNGVVTKRKWVDDKELVELLAVSQTLPGLNSTNMAVLVGDNKTNPALLVLAGAIVGAFSFAPK
ncbi:MAG TPA: chromate transporter [Candidatus Limnocylindrales bacterium]|jgi:chromate transport protein ChrA|nr:chromate transporter [Candidatus Limnocylindrales bacterium]